MLKKFRRQIVSLALVFLLIISVFSVAAGATAYEHWFSTDIQLTFLDSNENEIIMSTSRGTLAVRGEELHIEKLSLDGGELRVEGRVDSLLYEDDGERPGGGLLARLFG